MDETQNDKNDIVSVLIERTKAGLIQWAPIQSGALERLTTPRGGKVSFAYYTNQLDRLIIVYVYDAIHVLESLKGQYAGLALSDLKLENVYAFPESEFSGSEAWRLVRLVQRSILQVDQFLKGFMSKDSN